MSSSSHFQNDYKGFSTWLLLHHCSYVPKMCFRSLMICFYFWFLMFFFSGGGGETKQKKALSMEVSLVWSSAKLWLVWNFKPAVNESMKTEGSSALMQGAVFWFVRNCVVIRCDQMWSRARWYRYWALLTWRGAVLLLGEFAVDRGISLSFLKQ